MKTIKTKLALLAVISLVTTTAKAFLSVETLAVDHFVVLLSQELRQEKSVNREYDFESFSNFAMGLGMSKYTLFFERASFSDDSGSGSQNVNRAYESYALWGQYQLLEQDWGIPFISAGLGASRERINTVTLGTETSDQSGWKSIMGAGCGFRAPIKSIWLGAEVRLATSEQWRPNPFLSFLGRIGLYF